MRLTATANAAPYFCLMFWAVGAFGCGPKPQSPPVAAPVVDPGSPAPDRSESAGPDAAPPPATESSPPRLGESATTAIEVCRPQGQTEYLSRLRCPDGNAPTFVRRGQRGYRNPRTGDDDYHRSVEQVTTGRALEEGETDLHPVDLYAVTCRGNDDPRALYLDMYHCTDDNAVVEAPPGFSLAAPEK